MLTRKEASGSTVDSEPVYISAKQETSFDVDESLNVSRTPRSMVVDKVEGGRRLRTDEAAGPGPTKEEDEKKHETEDEIQEEREPCDVPVTDASLAKIARMLLSGELVAFALSDCAFTTHSSIDGGCAAARSKCRRQRTSLQCLWMQRIARREETEGR